MTMRSPDNNQMKQRVKVGATGLAAVVLIIGVASAIFTVASQDDPSGVQNAAPVIGRETGNATPPRTNEPLAELGVAPGTSESPTPAAEVTPPAPEAGR